VSVLLDETISKYEKMQDSGKKSQLEKMVSKGSIISSKLKKKNEINNKHSEKVRDKMDTRFERNRSARSMV
jgi:hypothetical protein